MVRRTTATNTSILAFPLPRLRRRFRGSLLSALRSHPIEEMTSIQRLSRVNGSCGLNSKSPFETPTIPIFYFFYPMRPINSSVTTTPNCCSGTRAANDLNRFASSHIARRMTWRSGRDASDGKGQRQRPPLSPAVAARATCRCARNVRLLYL